VRGDKLGAGVYPGCNDTGSCGESDPDTPTTVWHLRGVDSSDAVVARQQGRDRFVVYAPLHTDPTDLFRRTRDGGWELRNR
jgi:hypothetical protein